MSTRRLNAATVRTTAIAALLLANNVAAQPSGEETIRERGRELTRSLFAGEVDAVVELMDASYLQQLGGTQAVRAFAGRLSQFGPESRVLEEAVYRERQTNHYYRVARYENTGDTRFTTQWAWNENNQVVAVGVKPVPAGLSSTDRDQWPEQRLRLPFEGEWYTQWGGDLPHENYHVSATDQRFANDFLIVKNNRSHEGDGTRNSDYHCFGRPVLAPADGEVVRAMDGVADNTPGEMNREQIFGNHVVIAHGDSLYSILAHLRHGSVAVETGQSVSTGETLGECGNSGHSSEPHLHYHLQDSPEPGQGEGVPAPFSDYCRGDSRVERDRPRRGDFTRPHEH